MEQLPRITDADLINYFIDEAERLQQPISDHTARCIAAQLHSGVNSKYLDLATTGAINQEMLELEITVDWHDGRLDPECKRWLFALMCYVIETGDREPVAGWHMVWPVMLNHPEAA
jgi:hypothetical protein